MGWDVVNTSTGTLNIARLIEEAEAQLLGEEPKSCGDHCGKCKPQSCIDKKVKHAIGRRLADAK
ncbi:hypothetical protein BH09PLA1_BH09PLA1_14500 [soil metagenome]